MTYGVYIQKLRLREEGSVGDLSAGNQKISIVIEEEAKS
jgi:hypothetical protein